MQVSLNQVKPLETAVITHIYTDPHLTRRLRAFGLVPGTKVLCRYRNPGKSLTALEFRDTVVALRTKDLQMILVGIG